MANVPGPQPDIRFCPICKSEIRNIPRDAMKSRAHVKTDGTTLPDTHTYECIDSACATRFEINQDR